MPLWDAAMQVLHRVLELPRSHGVVFTNPASGDGVIPDSTIRRAMQRAGSGRRRMGSARRSGRGHRSAARTGRRLRSA